MNNELLNNLIEKYKLTLMEHGLVFEELKKKIFLNQPRSNNPSVMFVVGAPGSGKTTFIQHEDLSGYVIINSDEYRQFNRYSKEILQKYPTYYAKLTNFDAHLWGDELFLYAIQNGYSVLREKAPIDFSLLELIKEISSKFPVIINVVVVGNLTSLLATRERYEKELLKSNDAKLSGIESHNKCYQLLPDFVSKCLQLGIEVNYIVPVKNEFQIIKVGNDYLTMLNKFRQESNELTSLEYENRMDNIKKSMNKRNAPQQQFDELEKIENIYLDIVNKKSFIKK